MPVRVIEDNLASFYMILLCLGNCQLKLTVNCVQSFVSTYRFDLSE